MRGLGLVELMVALALGLFIVLAGITLALSQLREQHRRLVETRLRQEVRAVLAFAEHDTRRAGTWGQPGLGLSNLETGTPPLANPYTAVSPEGGASSPGLAYTYSRDATENHTVDTAERFGLRLNVSGGTIEARIGDSWQALTDPLAARFTALVVSARSTEQSLVDRCSVVCPSPPTADCPPRQIVRTLDIDVAAQATTLPALRLQQRRTVHLPNDAHVGRCPT